MFGSASTASKTEVKTSKRHPDVMHKSYLVSPSLKTTFPSTGQSHGNLQEEKNPLPFLNVSKNLILWIIWEQPDLLTVAGVFLGMCFNKCLQIFFDMDWFDIHQLI